MASVAALASTTLSSPIEGAHWATVALFASPNFLYRPELGANGSDGVRRLTDYEMASRLSFLLWNTVPDAALLDAAASGALATTQGIRAQVERMVGTLNGRQAIGEFAEEYMRLDRIGTQAKDAALFPEYDSALQTAMVRDMRGTWEAVAFDDQESALSLFSTRKVVANAPLAKLYGLDAAGLDAKTFKVLTLPEDSPRLGILSKAGFLSQFANQKEGSPTLRGKFMRGALMCVIIPPPPADVSPTLEDLPVDTLMTKRQRLEQHRTNASLRRLSQPDGSARAAARELRCHRSLPHHRPRSTDRPFGRSGRHEGRRRSSARHRDELEHENRAVPRAQLLRLRLGARRAASRRERAERADHFLSSLRFQTEGPGRRYRHARGFFRCRAATLSSRDPHHEGFEPSNRSYEACSRAASPPRSRCRCWKPC